MSARRVIALSPDKALGKQITLALKAAGGAVETYATPDELGTGQIDAALLVLHLEEALAGVVLSRLVGSTQVIALLPRSNLAAVVDIMRSSDRVAGMLVAEDFEIAALSAMATRVLAGDIFGLDKVVPWGTQIHSVMVGSYDEKAQCIAQVSEFAEQMGVRRKYREGIDQCLDEMLMNALYDAPVDEHGKPLYAEVATKSRVALRPEHKALVQYACDGTRFALAVRDAFGGLERATVLRYLHKCLHDERQIDRKAGGAGLGLYLMTSSSSSVMFNVYPGVATEATCTFDLGATKVEIESFGYFTEHVDEVGRLAPDPARSLPPGMSHPVERRANPSSGSQTVLVAVLVGLIVATVALIAVVLANR